MSVDDAAGTVAGKARAVADLARLIDARRVPTAEQAEIAGWGADPALVVAGAGSGKTETLSMRMVYLLDHARELWGEDASPDQILCLTFTRKAAARSRPARASASTRRSATTPPAPPRRWRRTTPTPRGSSASTGSGSASTRTPSSSPTRLVADRRGDRRGVDRRHRLGVVRRARSSAPIPTLAAAAVRSRRDPADLAALAASIADAVAAMPSRANRKPGPPTRAARDVIARFRARAAMAPLLEEFARRKREGSFLDFADQIALAGRLARIPAVRAVERSRYRAVLLDEFQDTSHGQLDLFATMFGDGHPVMAVGDPHQAIYGFRGASAESLAAFVERFGGPDAVGHLTLSTSWRNAPGVLDAANAVTEPLRATARVAVPELRPRAGAGDSAVVPITMRMYADSRAEAAGVVEEVVARRAAVEQWWEDHPGEARDGCVTAAILCRARRQFPAIVAALRERGVRYQVVGLGDSSTSRRSSTSSRCSRPPTTRAAATRS